MEPFELRSDRALLSPPNLDDVDRIAELCQDPEIQEWTTMPAPYSRTDAELFTGMLVPNGWARSASLTWAIRDLSVGRVDGMIGVDLSGDGKGDIGFWLAPNARGQGLMSHVVRLVAERVLSDASLGVTHLMWWAYVGNWASRRVAWATGFRHEGQVRGGQPQRGRRRDAWVATLCAGDSMTPAARWLDVPVIRGERVVLRPFEETDADAVTEACGDPISQWWLSNLPRPYTRDDALEHIRGAPEEAASGRAIQSAAAPPGGGAAIGSFALSFRGSRNDQGVIGYLVHPAARGTGIATEAVRMLVRHAFIATDDGGLGLRRLVIEHADGNDASRKVIERVGFRHSGVERAACPLPDGTYADHHRYDLLADEFE